MKLNEKVFNDLQNKIHNGFLKVGDNIPTEKELMNEYSISRSPVRDALSRLQNEGYIKREPKKGSVVISTTRVSRTIDFKGGFSKYFSDEWVDIETVTLDVSIIANKSMPEQLTNSNDEAIRVLRIRKYKGEPVFFLKTFYPVSVLDSVDITEFYDVNDLRNFIQNKTSFKFKHSNEVLEAISSDTIVSNNLEIPINSSILKISRSTFDESHNLVEFVEYHVNTAIWKYHTDYTF